MVAEQVLTLHDAEAEPRRGDFEDWYRAEHPKVLAALSWVATDIDVARDATDEAFARAFLHWARLSRMASPAGWTYRVALNVLRRRMRRAAMERSTNHPPPAVAPAADPELWAVVAALPERQRVAVVLRYLLDLPESEVARIMGIAAGTAASTLSAARARLAKWLDEDEVD